MSRHRWLPLVVVVCVLAALGALAATPRTGTDGGEDRTATDATSFTKEDGSSRASPSARMFSSDEPVARGCGLGQKLLLRIWRGYRPGVSEDVVMVPQFPNYTTHSGPWDYLVRVPLVLYGPEQIRAHGAVLNREATITNVYPTVGRLLGVGLPRRDGEVLEAALRPDRPGAPRLLVVVVWDGVGRNVLERWPEAWPHLARLEREGTSYYDASVGSSPTITPATHATLGTGTWPRAHGVTGIYLRGSEGVEEAFKHKDPSVERVTTFADDIDQALGNVPQAGMVAWKSWHLGMLGHGAQLPGGDLDHVALVRHPHDIRTNPNLYSLPPYLGTINSFKRHAAELDRTDGKADGNWMGHDIEALHDNPAWVNYEADVLMSLMRNEGYGLDASPDILTTNFKMTDIVGHQYTMDSPEMEAALRAQDAALGRMVGYLEEAVGNYVVIVTADHGSVPSAERTGAWPIYNGELARDVDSHFGVPGGSTLVEKTVGVGLFLDHRLMREMDIGAESVARYLNGYSIGENWTRSELPSRFRGREQEPILSAAFTRAQLPAVMKCAFGSPTPPPGSSD
jgi:Type I phosphodiesterase / nucleotide pyrophosphatase